MRKILFVVVALMLTTASSVGVVQSHGEERHASFLGATIHEHEVNEDCAHALGEPECVTHIPQGLVHVVCDDDSGDPRTLGLYDGIGGVRFCEIPTGAVIELMFTRLTGALGGEAIVTCPKSLQPVIWDEEIARFTSEGPVEFQVPLWCNDHAATTPVTVFIVNARTTDGTAYAPIEGEVALRSA